MLSNEQMERYSRHILLKEVGADGQKKLLNAKVLIIGAGGLGSPAAIYLAAVGVGTIGIADQDKVELSNLQRQILHRTKDLGIPKVISARETIVDLNPDVTVNPYHCFISADNIMELIDGYDFVIDATDNFTTKFLINDACVLSKKPFCHGGVIRFQGQLMTYVPGQGPCYRCIFKGPPIEGGVPTCQEVGLMGPIPGVIGTLQALEAIKFILGTGDLLTGYILTFDALRAEFHKAKLPAHVADCPVCGDHPTILKLTHSEQPVSGL